jgi:L-asparaginase II
MPEPALGSGWTGDDVGGRRPSTSRTYRGGEYVAEVVRSGFVESRHRGSVVILDTAGSPVLTLGDPDGPIFPRSSLKPLQAVGSVRAGYRPASAAELALVAGSHHGEAIHADAVRAMLRAGGLTEEHLGCPAWPPLGNPAGEVSRVSCNCSGKHAGMLLACVAAGWPVGGYLDPAHPVQKEIRAATEDLAGERVAATGVDGCGAPVFALSLRGLARAFHALVAGVDATATRVADAMRTHPEMAAGTGPGAYDTRLMRATPGLLAKGGAEGVQAVSVPGAGTVVIKVDDGAKRALMPVLSWALARLGLDVATPAEPVTGGDREVGAVRTVL